MNNAGRRMHGAGRRCIRQQSQTQEELVAISTTQFNRYGEDERRMAHAE
jgi:hypothetical protein